MIRRYRPWSALAALLLLVWSVYVIDLNWPGHLSVDSLIQVEEGRTGVIKSYNPIFITIVFGKLAQLGGSPLLIICATLMLAAAVWGLLPPADRFGLPALAVLASALCAPVLVIYPAIVWKDVWFAHAALLGFALIARRRRFTGWVADAGCVLLFAMAMLSRQTGGIVAVIGMATLAWARHRDQVCDQDQPRAFFGLLKRAAVYLIALFTVALGLAAAARLMVQSVSAGEVSTGLRLLLMFDIAGMVTRQSAPDLTVLAAFGVDTALLAQAARATFSAERIDALDFTKGCSEQRRRTSELNQPNARSGIA